MNRKWTAQIVVADGRTRTTFDATRSHSDLLADQTQVALQEAALFVDDAHDVTIALVKTIATGSTVDRWFSVYRDKHGDVVAQRS